MQPRIRGLAKRRESLYLIGPQEIIELEEPGDALLMVGSKTRKVSPEAALYPFVAKRASLRVGSRGVEIWGGGMAAAVSAGMVIVERAKLASSRSLQIASMVAETLVPGIPYYDAVWRSPGLAVPEWALAGLERACRQIPLIECPSL